MPEKLAFTCVRTAREGNNGGNDFRERLGAYVTVNPWVALREKDDPEQRRMSSRGPIGCGRMPRLSCVAHGLLVIYKSANPNVN